MSILVGDGGKSTFIAPVVRLIHLSAAGSVAPASHNCDNPPAAREPYCLRLHHAGSHLLILALGVIRTVCHKYQRMLTRSRRQNQDRLQAGFTSLSHWHFDLCTSQPQSRLLGLRSCSTARTSSKVQSTLY